MKFYVGKKNISGLIPIILLILMFCTAIFHIFAVRYKSGGIWSYYQTIFQCLIFLICFIYILIHIASYKKIDAFILCLCLYILYETFITCANNRFDLLDMTCDAYTWPALFIVYYLFFYANSLDLHLMKAFQMILVFGTMLCAILFIPNVGIHLLNYGFSGKTIGPIYFFVGFLLLIFMFCNRTEIIIFFVIISGIILFSTKRGPFLDLALGFSMYFILKNHIERTLSRQFWKYICLVLGTGLIIIVLVNQFNIQTFMRFRNLFADQGSGRVELWQDVIQKYMEAPFIKQLFGHGFHAVPDEVRPLNRHIYAHSSYLETLYDLGIIGLVWLLFLLFYFVKKIMLMLKERFRLAPLLGFALVYILSLSATGYFFERSDVILPVAIFAGMCLGIYRKTYRNK